MELKSSCSVSRLGTARTLRILSQLHSVFCQC
uniref:Uncharacterized protein n=1 Tax=Anguilla anguilla TaxID=7936 RepID=A0A0E9XGN7_ANGAN